MLTLENALIQQGEFSLSGGFRVAAGSTTAIIGPSGGGKSTLLNALAGFTSLRSGEIKWGPDDLASLSPGERPISIVFQDNNLFPHLSAFDNVAIGVRPSLALTSPEKQSVKDALSSVGLNGFQDRKPAALSGGQQSRVVLARVLLREKPLLLLDEPFAALGPALRGEMLDLVAKLVAETRATLLMVTHDPRDALKIAQDTIVVEAGKIHAPVATRELLNDPPPGLLAYLGDQQFE